MGLPRRKSKPKGWRGQEFSYGDAHKITGHGPGGPGQTPGEDNFGRPRALDFEHFDAVDWSLNDQAEDFS